ncbi:F0F1 ATP synthase subunit delta [Roseospira navarrensis]|uniref:F0F1 ATP synthase subunit delta n=1 Tax=Roseospira navarrensis TaxID=140058 RepID=UPI001478A5E8
MASQSTRVSGLAVRYAAALYELADEARDIDPVARDLSTLQTMLDESEDLRRFIASPVVSRDDHAKGIAALADAADIGATTRKFLGLVASKGRLVALPGMILAFQRQLAKARGEMTAEVVSARPLSETQSAALAARLKQVVGNEVAIDARVEPALLGGMVVRLGSRMVDSSLRSQLQRLSLSMKGVG